MKRLITLALLCASLATGCINHYVVHPGSVNTFDSTTYDALIAAKAIIENARAQHEAGVFPEVLVPPIEAVVDAYNAAYPAWLVWRTSLTDPNATQLLAQLNAALAALVKAETQFNTVSKAVKK